MCLCSSGVSLMAEHKPQTGSRKSKSIFEIYEKRRRGEKERSQTKVILGAAFPRWRALKAQRGLRSDALVATFLLDSFDKVSSTPVPHTPGVCTVCQGSLSARDDKSSVAEIEEVLDDTCQQLDPRDEDISEDSDTERNNSNFMDTPDGQLDENAESEEADSNTEAVSEEDGSDESQCETSSEKDDRPSPHVQTGDAPKRRKHQEGMKNSRLPSTSSEESAGHQNDVFGDSSPPEQPPQPSHQPIDLRLSPEPSPTETAAAEAEGETETKSSGTEDSSDDEPDQSQDNCSTTTELFPQKDVESDSPSRAKSYDCLTCGKVFSNSSALRRHLVIHTGKRPHKCFICGRGFTQSGNLKTHMKVHKGEVPNWALIQEKPAPREPHVRAHVCSDCGMDFPNLEQLVEHRDTHKKPYACPDCGKAFKVEAYFKQHTLMHTGGLAFPCSECGKPWATLDLLRKHEQCHSTERSFHCDQCGKAFSKAASLKVHLKTHTGERTYLCSVCGKSYSKAHPLKVHLRVHTGEKPYICHTCGKGFYYLQGYQKHILIHNKKPKPRSKPLGRPKQLLLLTDA